MASSTLSKRRKIDRNQHGKSSKQYKSVEKQPSSTTVDHELVCRALSIVCELSRIKINTLLRTYRLSVSYLMALLKYDTTISMQTLGLPLVCKSIYLNVAPCIHETAILSYVRSVLRKSLLSCISSFWIPSKQRRKHNQNIHNVDRWWFTYDDGMAKLLRRACVNNPSNIIPSDKMKKRIHLSTSYPSHCATAVLKCSPCEETDEQVDNQLVPLVVRKWTNSLIRIQNCRSSEFCYKTCCRRLGCTNTVPRCHQANCLLTLCTRDTKSSAFLTYLLHIAHIRKPNEIHRLPRLPAIDVENPCTCFCSSSCMKAVRNAIPNAFSESSLHGWKQFGMNLALSHTSMKRPISLSAAERRKDSYTTEPMDNIAQVSSNLQEALERNKHFAHAGRRQWEQVPLSTLDRESIRELYIRCYNVDVGMLYVSQTMQNVQTGWSLLRQVSGTLKSFSSIEALKTALACYTDAYNEHNSKVKANATVVSSIQMHAGHAYVNSINCAMRLLQHRDNRLVGSM